MKGRKPIPTAQKKLHGNPGKRPLNLKEPMVLPVTDLTCPAWMNTLAQETWDELAPLLSDMRVFTKADKQALEVLCVTYAEWRRADAFIEENGETYKTYSQTGAVMHRAYPQVAIRADAHRRLKAMQAEFGMTPSSRSRIQVDTPDVDPLETYLNHGKASH